MKLLKWAVGGASVASVYAIYKYSIGRKAKGEDIFPHLGKLKPPAGATPADAAPAEASAEETDRAEAAE